MRIEIIAFGFLCGMVVLIYIHVLIIHRKLYKLLKGIDEASFEADYDIREVEEREIYFKDEKLNRLMICKDMFRILNRAIHLS